MTEILLPHPRNRRRAGVKWRDLRNDMVWRSKRSGNEVTVKKTSMHFYLLDNRNKKRYIRLENLNKHYVYVRG